MRSPEGSIRPPGRRVWWLLGGWLVVVCFGMAWLFAYSAEPGTEANAPRHWPADTALQPARGLPTLVLVAHPRCSCTRASVAELSRLMTRLQGQVAGYVLFVKPPGTDDDWERTDLWASAARIEGVEVVSDVDGVEAARFGAATSGQVYLYTERGELVFEGGITPTRAHEGDSVGQQRIVELVTRGATDRGQSAVYGCELHEESREQSWLAGLFDPVRGQ